MSADNWTQCPKCLQSKEGQREKARRKVEAAYGKVPADKFMEMQDALKAEEAKKDDLNMREDYEQGTDEAGVYAVSYSCSCQACGFRWAYKHAERVL